MSIPVSRSAPPVVVCNREKLVGGVLAPLGRFTAGTGSPFGRITPPASARTSGTNFLALSAPVRTNSPGCAPSECHVHSDQPTECDIRPTRPIFRPDTAERHALDEKACRSAHFTRNRADAPRAVRMTSAFSCWDACRGWRHCPCGCASCDHAYPSLLLSLLGSNPRRGGTDSPHTRIPGSEVHSRHLRLQPPASPTALAREGVGVTPGYPVPDRM